MFKNMIDLIMCLRCTSLILVSKHLPKHLYSFKEHYRLTALHVRYNKTPAEIKSSCAGLQF